MDDLWTMIAAKFAGSFSGAILALLFQPPKTRSEGIRRLTGSLIAGLVLGEAVRQYLHLEDKFEIWMACAAIVAAMSWWVWGAAVRLIGAYKGPK